MSDQTPPPLPARNVTRTSSRRSLRSLSSNHDDPLMSSTSSDSTTTSTSPSQYAVYNGSNKKRASYNPLQTNDSSAGSPTTPTASASSPSTSTSPTSSIPTPPFHPTISLAPPPLVSRPSNSTLPSPSGRSYVHRSTSEAKEQLQKQALKAQLQHLGLSNESWGNAIVSRLARIGAGDEGDNSGNTKGIADVLLSDKVTLLLPTEKIDSSTFSIPTSILLDHLILLSPSFPSSSSNSTSTRQSFVTLSGLRGYLYEDKLTFNGTAPAVKATEHGIVRQSTLEPSVDYLSDDLHRYLRGPASITPSDTSSYPSISTISPLSTLSLPRTISPSAVAVAAASRTSTSSRLAALFSKSSPASLQPVANDPETAPPVSPNLSSDPSVGPSKSLPNFELSVLVTSTRVRFGDISKSIASAVEEDLRRSLEGVVGIKGDSQAMERILAFPPRLFPPSNWSSVYPPQPSAAATTSIPTSSSTSTTATLFEADVETISEAFQDLLHSTRLDLSRNLSIGSPNANPTNPSSSSSMTSPAAPEPSPGLEDFTVLEERVDVVLSEIEDLILSRFLHQHAFSPSSSSDGQDDENLCSRIAALNVLELSLDHLGVDLGDEGELEGWEGQKRGVRETVEDLAELVGKELARLEDPLDCTASSKLDVLVQAHKILVDELGKLPPIPLKKEIDPSSATPVDHSDEVEMDDASSRASSRAPSRPRSPTPQAVATDDELLKTPRPPPAFDHDVPEIKLPESTQAIPERDLDSSMHEATSSSLFEPTVPAVSPPTSVFDSSARNRASSIASSLRSPASVSSPPTSTSSADLILPFLIYSVVRSNPPRLTSHLRFSHRFRSESLMRGQASYCLTNFDAVVEFLNHVDVSSLGLSSQKVFAATNPYPISSSSTTSASRPRAYTTGRLSSRVTTELPGLIDTANSALSGVVDGSYRMLFGPKGLSAIASGVGGAAPRSLEDVKGVLEGARGRARMGLPFRRSASVATLPTDSKIGNGGKKDSASNAQPDKVEEMVDFQSNSPDVPAAGYDPPASPTQRPSESTSTLSPDASPSKSTVGKDEDTRSIRSISSLIRDTTLGRTLGEMGSVTMSGVPTTTSGQGDGDRPSLGERFSGFTGLGRFGGGGSEAKAAVNGSNATTTPGSTRPSIFSAFGQPTATSPASSRRPTLSSSPAPSTVPLSANDSTTSLVSTASSTTAFHPIQKFLELGNVNDLKLGEVRELLESYRELVAVWESEREARKMGLR